MMKKIDRLDIKFNGRKVGLLSLSPDNRQCIFEYDRNCRELIRYHII